MQTFFAECGLSENTIFIINSLLNILQVLTLLIASPMIDKSKNVIRLTGLIHTLSIPLVMFLLYSCYRQGIFGTSSYTIMGACFFISQVGVGLYICISYKIPYHVIDMKKYGKISSLSGALSFVATFLLSSLLTYIQSGVGYFTAIAVMFMISFLSIIVFTTSTLSLKEINHFENDDNEKKDRKINIFKYRPFYTMIIPNLFRGICGGGIGAVVTIGYYCNILDAKSAGILVIITSLMSFAGYIIYPFLEKIMNEGRIILIFSVINMLTMPFMFIFHSPAPLLVLYAVAFLTSIVIGTAVPVGVAKVVDYEVMGQYSGYRMLIHLTGAASFGFMSMFLLKTIGATGAMFFVALLQLISGILYFRFFKKESCKF